MTRLLKGRYMDGPKGYLTYPISNIKGDERSAGLQDVLLTEYHETRHTVSIDGKVINEITVTKPFADALEKIGAKVQTLKRRGWTGRKSLTIFIDGADKIIPVEIHKINKGKEIKEIQIRVTVDKGENERVLLKYMDAIKNSLSRWHIKPTECVWSQGGLTEDSTKPTVDEKKIRKEDERIEKILREHKDLKGKVEDIEDDVNDLKKAPLRKSIKEDREVRAGVLK